MNKKIALSFGTRPELIKVLPVYWELIERYGRDRILLIHTGQHSDLLERELNHFQLDPDIKFELNRTSGHLSELTGKLLLKFEELSEMFLRDNTEIVAVIAQGDTASTFSSALHAFHQKIPFFHIEAGLRTFDRMNPFPEEFYRRSIAEIAHFHFAPTPHEYGNLINEGKEASTILVTGNTVIDHLTKIEPTRTGKEVIITLHRRELSDTEFQKMIDYFAELIPHSPDWSFKWISHPNRKVDFTRLENNSNFKQLNPVPFHAFLELYKDAGLIYTDSGGIQEEAAYLGIPCVVCRKKTERKSGIIKGVSKLFDPLVKTIGETQALFNLDELPPKNPVYGDGQSGRRIAEVITSKIP